MLKKLGQYILFILSSVGLFTEYSHAANFHNPTDKKFSYIFVPGMISTETQTAKYIPEFIGSSGEKITCSTGIHTLNHPISTCTFSEVSAQPLTEQSMNPFVHFGYWFTDRFNKKYGVSVQRQQSQQLDQTPENPEQPAQFTPPTSGYTLEKHSFDFTKFNWGQEADIAVLLKTYNEHMQKHQDTLVVGWGVASGAATLCNFMAEHKPENVKALVLEAPFDSISHCLKHSCGKAHIILNKILPKLTAYDPNGVSPINSVEKISKDIPVLIICSKMDGVIPRHCSESLGRKFAKQGQPVHLLVLNKSTHSGYAFDNYADKLKYESVVHAFYKHYGLPYDEDLASQGSEEWKKISGQSAMMPRM